MKNYFCYDLFQSPPCLMFAHLISLFLISVLETSKLLQDKIKIHASCLQQVGQYRNKLWHNMIQSVQLQFWIWFLVYLYADHEVILTENISK